MSGDLAGSWELKTLCKELCKIARVSWLVSQAGSISSSKNTEINFCCCV